jgi:hypothetical protein
LASEDASSEPFSIAGGADSSVVVVAGTWESSVVVGSSAWDTDTASDNPEMHITKAKKERMVDSCWNRVGRLLAFIMVKVVVC